MHPIPKADTPLHTVRLDISVHLSGKNKSKKYVIVQVDAFSKYVFLHNKFDLDTENCSKNNIICSKNNIYSAFNSDGSKPCQRAGRTRVEYLKGHVNSDRNY